MNIQPLDGITLLVSLALLVLGVLTSMLSPFFRFCKKVQPAHVVRDPADTTPHPLPPLSIVLTPHDEADRLARHLPALLQQDYPSGYQVIVVVEQHDSKTRDLLKRIQAQHEQQPCYASLYITYIPDSSRYMSRKKLAVTLGVKAATTEWIVLTEACCQPASDQWLKHIGQHCGDNRLVIGYNQYEEGTADFKRFSHAYTAHYLMREAQKGTAYRTNGTNMAFRKSDFMAGNGYLGNLNLIRGEYDFIVNKFATKGTTALVLDSEAYLIDDEPTPKAWTNRHIYYLETRKYLLRSRRHRLLFNLDQTALHLNYLLQLTAIAVATLTGNVWILAAAGVALLATLGLRLCFAHRALKAMGENVPLLKIVPFEASLIWHHLGYLVRHRMADKLNFTTHKL